MARSGFKILGSIPLRFDLKYNFKKKQILIFLLVALIFVLAGLVFRKQLLYFMGYHETVIDGSDKTILEYSY